MCRSWTAGVWILICLVILTYSGTDAVQCTGKFATAHFCHAGKKRSGDGEVPVTTLRKIMEALSPGSRPHWPRLDDYTMGYDDDDIGGVTVGEDDEGLTQKTGQSSSASEAASEAGIPAYLARRRIGVHSPRRDQASLFPIGSGSTNRRPLDYASVLSRSRDRSAAAAASSRDLASPRDQMQRQLRDLELSSSQSYSRNVLSKILSALRSREQWRESYED